MLNVSSVSKVFKRKNIKIEALGEISISIADGDFVSVVGPSGCGKTTLLRMIAGLVDPSEGVIEIQGATPAEYRKRRGIGFVFQKPLMFPWRSVLENVLLPVEIRNSVDLASPTTVAMEHLASLGLEGFEHVYPNELSGGMLQRAALARALILKPRLLLLDEPFSALDEISREKIWIDFSALYEKHKLTVMLVTHSIREAVCLGNRVLVMSKRPGTIFRDIQSPFNTKNFHDVKNTIKFNELCETIRADL